MSDRAARRHRHLPVAAAAALALLAPGAAAARAGEANPPLRRTTVEIAGRVRVSAEVARTPLERQLGLSNRPALPPGQGMLFLFGQVGPASIWMPDMRFPIDILWIRGGRIVRIVERAQPLRPDRPPEVFTAVADAVLEVPAGFAGAHRIAVGDAVRVGGAGAAPRGNR